jgi:hypothetical protein
LTLIRRLAARIFTLACCERRALRIELTGRANIATRRRCGGVGDGVPDPDTLELAVRFGTGFPQAADFLRHDRRRGTSVIMAVVFGSDGFRHLMGTYNLLGEYECSDEKLRDSVGIPPPKNRPEIASSNGEAKTRING